jgi:hypothetical protein
MKTNLDKWNEIVSTLDEKSTEFIKLNKEWETLPDTFYEVRYNGAIIEKKIKGAHYNWNIHGISPYFWGKSPTKKDITKLKESISKEITLSIENIYVNTEQKYGLNGECLSKSSIKIKDILTNNNMFFSMAEAEICAKERIKENERIKEFNELHKKDKTYNYSSNGYKFLGWQNGWKSTYYDEDGNKCSETGKPHKTCKYDGDEHLDYRKCVDSNHMRIKVQHTPSGSENVVSCPVCKIFWKYDCSG